MGQAWVSDLDERECVRTERVDADESVCFARLCQVL